MQLIRIRNHVRSKNNWLTKNKEHFQIPEFHFVSPQWFSHMCDLFTSWSFQMLVLEAYVNRYAMSVTKWPLSLPLVTHQHLKTRSLYISSPTFVTNIKTKLILSQIKLLLKITERIEKSLETTGENASCYTSACSTFQNALIDIQWQLYETHGSFWTFYQKYSISSFWSCLVRYLSNLYLPVIYSVCMTLKGWKSITVPSINKYSPYTDSRISSEPWSLFRNSIFIDDKYKWHGKYD